MTLTQVGWQMCTDGATMTEQLKSGGVKLLPLNDGEPRG